MPAQLVSSGNTTSPYSNTRFQGATNTLLPVVTLRESLKIDGVTFRGGDYGSWDFGKVRDIKLKSSGPKVKFLCVTTMRTSV